MPTMTLNPAFGKTVNKLKNYFVLLIIFFVSLEISGQNLISNGDFETGFSNWMNLAQGGSVATFSLETSEVAEGQNAMKIDITNLGENPWDVQSIHNGWPSEDGTAYILTLKAKAVTNGASFIAVQQKSTYDQRSITLTTSYKEFEWPFIAQEDNLQLKFLFPNAGVFYVDDVVIVASDSIPALPLPSGRRLREIVEDKYSDSSVIIGATTGAWAFDTYTGLIMDREFSYVTPENDFKQWNIHPDPVTWNWTQTDSWVNHIRENGQILRMHCPIGPQCSVWSQTDSRTEIELEQLMREFMQAVCEHYNGLDGIVSMDVVNETVQWGRWKKDEPGTGGWELPWYKIGLDTDENETPLYIRYAFEIANEYAPDLKLIFNHHEDPNSVSSWNLIKATIGYLRDRGLRVDGIGWQAHVNNGWATTISLNRLRDLIDWAHENDLEFHVTEASVWINGDHTESAFQNQASTYSHILQVLMEKRFNGFVGWNIWHIDDGHGWQIEKVPSLFDENYEAKPAYYAIQETLENPPLVTTNHPKLNKNAFQLYKNYPNPFHSTTTIAFSLPEFTHVELVIFDAAGRKLITLVNEEKASGEHEIIWNGNNSSGQLMHSGAYFYQIKAKNFTKTCKMMLLE